MSFISMDLLGPSSKTVKGNQYALTVTGMLMNYVFMIPIRPRSTEKSLRLISLVYTPHLGQQIYSKQNRGSEFTSKQFT